jgi:hypothetical protein
MDLLDPIGGLADAAAAHIKRGRTDIARLCLPFTVCTIYDKKN